MTIPGFQDIMLPLMQLASDGQEHRLSDAAEALADSFKLTPAEREQLLPSGRQPTFDNRVAWASSYLRHAGLLDSAGRGRYRITERGRSELNSKPARIDIPLLMKYPEFKEFRQGVGKPVPPASGAAIGTVDATPEEVLENTYQQLRTLLQQDLLERVKAVTPGYFERLVVNLLVAMGYGGSRADAGRAVGRSGDGGIDGIIKEDKLGLDAVYVQAKRWDAPVGSPTVQAFSGSLDGQKARKGVLITTSTFSAEARAYVEKIEKRIVLIDGRELAKLMIDHGVGVTEVANYTVKRIDAGYFEEE